MLSSAPLLRSAYLFPSILFLRSWSRTDSSRTSDSGRRQGSFVFTSYMSINEAGVAPVVPCGVVLYANRNFRTAVLGRIFSILAIFIVFPRLLLKFSTSPFAWAHSGADVQCTIPFLAIYSLNSPPTKLRSVVTFHGEWKSEPREHLI